METNMEKRIEEQLDGLTKEEVVELNLDNCQATQIEGVTDEFKSLVSLSFINCGLTSLKGFPNLPELKRLELSDNRLSGTLDFVVSGCPKITHLHLGGNKIKELEALEPLKELADLKKLDLLNCEVTETEGYREKVFKLLPQITYLDGLNANNEQDEEEDEDDEEEENEEDEEEEEEGEEEDREDEVGLSYLQKSGLEEESDGEEFQPNGTHDDDDDDDEDEDSEGEEDMEDELAGGDEGAEKDSPAVPRGRGVKRKRATEEENGGAGDSTEVVEKNGKVEETTEPAVASEESPAAASEVQENGGE